MRRRKQQGDSLDQKKWFKSTQAILTMAGGAIALVSGLITLGHFAALRWGKAYENIEIVVDASEGMRAPFHGKTKRDAIKAALEEVLSKQTADRDKLALRKYSGECNGDKNTQLLLKFARNNRREIRNALTKLELQGKAPLAAGVVKATGDFPASADVNKRIIVIAGDAGCDEKPEKYIRDRLQNGGADKKIKLDLRFIYLGESAEQFKKLEEIAKATGGVAFPADTPERLKAALVRTIEIEPVLSDIRASTEILNGVVDQTNKSLEALNRKDYSAAQQGLKGARDEFDRTELLFQDFRKRQSRDLFRGAQQLASQNRDVQNRILAVSQQMIEQAQHDDTEAYKKLVQDFNALKDNYNGNAQKLDEIAQKIAQE